MDYIRLRNYRCFDDTGNIELRPINLMVGANSSGKSSIVKLFPLIKQSMGNKRNGVFLWYGDDVDFKDFRNVVKNGSSTLEMEFSIASHHFSTRGDVRSADSCTNIVVIIQIASKDDNFDYLKSLSIIYADQSIVFQFNENRSTVKVVINNTPIEEGFDTIFSHSTNSLLPRLLFSRDNHFSDEAPNWCVEQIKNIFGFGKYTQYRRIYRTLLLGSKADTVSYLVNQMGCEPETMNRNRLWLNNTYLLMHLNDLIDGINLHMLSISRNMSYVGPLRATTQRYYRFQNYAVESIDSDGKNLAMFLFNLEDDAKKAFREWTMNLFGFELLVKPVEGSVELLVSERTEEPRNMVDLGFGYTQLLPILAIIWYTIYKASPVSEDDNEGQNEYIIAIEQPELHLHPRLQGLFARMLSVVIRYTKNRNIDLRFVIETHSEIIASKLGEFVAMKELDKYDINVYLFNALKEGMPRYVEKSGYSMDGQLTNWPFGFFSDYVFED